MRRALPRRVHSTGERVPASRDLSFAHGLARRWEAGELTPRECQAAIREHYAIGDRAARDTRTAVGIVARPGDGLFEKCRVAPPSSAPEKPVEQQLEELLAAGGVVSTHDRHLALRELARRPVPLVCLRMAHYGPRSVFRRSAWELTPAGRRAAGVSLPGSLAVP